MAPFGIHNRQIPIYKQFGQSVEAMSLHFTLQVVVGCIWQDLQKMFTIRMPSSPFFFFPQIWVVA
jgi:hypothetical protein